MNRVLVQEGRTSYSKVRNFGACVVWPGVGRKSLAGRPRGNQTYEAQIPLLVHYNRFRRIPIHYKRIDGSIEYLGEYGIRSMEKKVSFEGFQYYEYVFLRIPVRFHQ
jgi:hypothetical protein